MGLGRYSYQVRQTPLRLVCQLGITQTIGYASSYYLSAILARPISQDLDFEFQNYFTFVAIASIIGGFLGPVLGKQIDRFGGRLVLPISSMLFAVGLALMSMATDQISFAAAWVVTGIAMAAGLYDAAFASTVEILGENSRQTIAGITLIAGFASTIGWPITSAIEQAYSWREAILFWAITHIVIALPLHLSLPGGNRSDRKARRTERAGQASPTKRAPASLVILTALLFVSGGFVQIALGAHLPQVIESAGALPPTALLAATFLGPGQVFARSLQVLLPSLLTPKMVAILALVLHPIGVLSLLLFETAGYFSFAVLHGMGSGFLTVAAGVLPLYLFGSKNYGERQGYIMAANDILLSFAPVFFGYLLIRFGALSLGATSASSMIALVILWFLLWQHGKVSKFSA